MSAGYLFDDDCCNCDWVSIGTIKPDKNDGTMPKPKPNKDSLDWIREHLSEQEYRGYLIGKIYEYIYSYVNSDQYDAVLGFITLYISLFENDQK